MIPAWMKEVDNAPCRFDVVRPGRRNFVRKTIDGVLRFFQETLVSESYTLRAGLLQGLDPRVKLIAMLALVVAISLAGDLRLLACVYLLTLLLAYLSQIGIAFFIKRVWLFIPIFTGIIALPLIFNVFYPGDSLITLVSTGGASIGPVRLPPEISITRQGLTTAAVFTLRVATSVSAVVLLFLTTRQDALFKSLRSIGVPRIYVLTLDMCYRYIFLFMEIVRDLYTARKSRTIRSQGTFAEQRWVGGRIGYTLIRTLAMSEKVHQSMISRGFTGDVKLLHDYHMGLKDYGALVLALAFSGLLVLVSYDLIKV